MQPYYTWEKQVWSTKLTISYQINLSYLIDMMFLTYFLFKMCAAVYTFCKYKKTKLF